MLERDDADARRCVRHRVAVAVCDEVLIVNRQQMDGAARHRFPSRRGDGPVGAAVDGLLTRLVDLEPTLRVDDLQARPPDEVSNRRGAVTGKVTSRQLRERFIARQSAGERRAVREQRVGELLVAPRAAADHSLQLGVDGDQRQHDALRGDTGAGELAAKLAARQARAAPQRTLEYRRGAGHQRRIESELAGVRRHRLMHARRGQVEHPSDVRRRDEMPGRAQHVRPENPPVVAGAFDLGVGRGSGHAQREAPPGGRVLLRLDGAEPGDDLFRTASPRPRDALVIESLTGDSAVHACGLVDNHEDHEDTKAFSTNTLRVFVHFSGWSLVVSRWS